jgi:hypothetical protein
MKWETPAFVEINMSAEIGGYQTDFSDPSPIGPPAPRTAGGQQGPAEAAATAPQR